MSTMTTAALEERAQALKKQFIGTKLQDAPVPSAILDLSKVKRNCARMLEAVDALGFGWRAHIKTHKTTELTRLQVGSAPRPANIITSTLTEAENILPLLLEYQATSRPTSLLYAFPLYPSAAPRLAALATSLGPKVLTLLLDHPSQVPILTTIHALSSTPLSITIKIDMGSHRAGIRPSSPLFHALLTALKPLLQRNICVLAGLYSHAGHSYSGADPATAIDLLDAELRALSDAANTLRSLLPSATTTTNPLTLSVGATPTTTTIHNLLHPPTPPTPSLPTPTPLTSSLTALTTTVSHIHSSPDTTIELHAGVYTTLDIQQLATHALPPALLSWDDLALTVLAEVASVYPERERPEALVTAGSIALGREPCKAYDGYGMVASWGVDGDGEGEGEVGPEGRGGWQVGKVSQEHGVLRWVGEGEAEKLVVGQRVRIWPNHACIAGTGFDWYLVVDAEGEGKGEVVVDVWVRWRGW